MKTTVVIDFELGLAWTLVENEYRFDYNATLETLGMLHNLRVSIANDPGPGWQMLYRAATHLENECEAYLRGK